MKILFSLFKGFTGAIFGLGAFLIIFGIASNISGVGVIDERYRTLAISSGFIIDIIAIILHFMMRERKPQNTDDHVPYSHGFLDDTELSETQKLILGVIIKDYVVYTCIHQDDVEKKCVEAIEEYNKHVRTMTKASENFFNKKEIEPIYEAEMYYRLEHLIFKGYINKKIAGRSENNDRFKFTYFLSEEYRKREGISKPNPKMKVI